MGNLLFLKMLRAPEQGRAENFQARQSTAPVLCSGDTAPL